MEVISVRMLKAGNDIFEKLDLTISALELCFQQFGHRTYSEVEHELVKVAKRKSMTKTKILCMGSRRKT